MKIPRFQSVICGIYGNSIESHRSWNDLHYPLGYIGHIGPVISPVEGRSEMIVMSSDSKWALPTLGVALLQKQISSDVRRTVSAYAHGDFNSSICWDYLLPRFLGSLDGLASLLLGRLSKSLPWNGIWFGLSCRNSTFCFSKPRSSAAIARWFCKWIVVEIKSSITAFTEWGACG
jgi:hypothetical protein